MPRRRYQFGVVAADRVDREDLAAERSGDFVGVQTCCVDHRACEDRLAGGPNRDPAASGGAAVETGAGQQRHLARDGEPRQGANVRLGLDDSRVDGDQMAAAASTYGSRRRTKARSTTSRSVTPLACARAASVSSAPISPASAATISLPQRAQGTPCSTQKGVQPLTSLDAENGLQGSLRVI